MADPAQLRDLRAELAADPALAVEAEGSELLGRLETFVCRYVVLPANARLTVALWVLATYLFEVFDAFPYLALLSPAKRCGKTRTQEVLELLVRSPWRGTAPSEAALFRYIADKKPVLLLDEVEVLATAKASERTQIIRAILNEGYRSGGSVIRCVPPSHQVATFPVYCPKCFAAIGRLPDTIRDRSIVISLQRKTKEDHVERFTFAAAKKEAEPLRKQIAELTKANAGRIAETYQNIGELLFLRDRDEELFAPLFSVLSCMAPGRVVELKQDAEALCGSKADEDEDDSLALRLLSDIRKAWRKAEDAIATKDLLARLNELDESPWSADYQLNSRRLARMLKPFGVKSRTVRIGTETAKGYIRSELEGASSRYLTDLSVTSDTSL